MYSRRLSLWNINGILLQTQFEPLIHSSLLWSKENLMERPRVVFTRIELEEKLVPQLRDICRDNKWGPFSRLKKAELIDLILRSGGVGDGSGSGSGGSGG